MKFIEVVLNEIKFNKIIVYIGREFQNKKNWVTYNDIELIYNVLFHHQRYGRIERLNRTIHERIKKIRGNKKYILSKIIYLYNNKYIQCEINMT